MSHMKIKSSWFETGLFKSMGKEEGLNLYIQLFRFRVHQGDFNEHVFRTSLLELRQFTGMNKNRRLSMVKLKELLQQLERVSVIQIHTPIDEMIGNEMLLIEAIDAPETKRVKEKSKDIDKPIDENNYYINVNLSMIDYIYNVLKLGSKEVALYLLIKKLSQGNREKKATMKINNMKSTLGTRNDKINEMLINLNKGRILATYVRKRKHGAGQQFEHVICNSVDSIKQFKKDNDDAIEIYLRRHKRK